MNDLTCQACVVTCIDFRFQPFINQWIGEHYQPRAYDRVALAGGVRNLETILQQIRIAHRLHQIKTAVLINHEDCLAYGDEGSDERHRHDLREAGQKIREMLPELEVETYYLRLNGVFERIV